MALTATKSFTPSSILSGGTSTLTITITNTGVSAITGISFTDTYPLDIVNVGIGNVASTNISGGIATGIGGSGSLSLAGGTLAGGTSGTVTVDVTGTIVGMHNNTTSPIFSNELPPASPAIATLTITAVPHPRRKKKRISALPTFCCDPKSFADGTCPPQILRNGYMYVRIGESNCYILTKK